MSAPPKRPSGSSSDAVAGRIVIMPGRTLVTSTRHHRSSLTTDGSGSAPRLEAQALGDVTGDRAGVQANPAESDMAVGTHEVERGLRDPRACEIGLVGRIRGDHVDIQQVIEIQRISGRGRLPHHDEIESLVVQLLVEILDGGVRLKL